MARLTPGALFLLRKIPNIAGCAGGCVLIHHVTPTATPTWLVVALYPIVGIIALASLITTRYILELRDASSKGARFPPIAQGERIANLDIMNLMYADYAGGWLGTLQSDQFRRLGSNTIVFRFFWDNLFFTIDPQLTKAILSTEFTNFEKGESFDVPMGSILGSGVFNSDGEMWKFHRSLARPFFTTERISHFELFDTHAMSAINAMKARLSEGHAVDIQDLMLRFTMDAATDFMFGSCVDSTTAGLPYPANAHVNTKQMSERSRRAEAFSNAFAEAQHICHQRVFFPPFPLFEMFHDKTAKPMAIVNSLLEPIVQEALEKQRTSTKGKTSEIEEHGTLLDSLVKQTTDPEILRDEILNIMIAGRAATLTFVVYFLCMYPDVRDKLRSEILQRLGSTERPTYDDVKDMKFLRAVINETLRLYPPVPFNIRQSVKATTWNSEDGSERLYIPAKTRIQYSVMLMHRRKDLWGEDAEEFDPARWIDQRLQQFYVANPAIFVPFNAGPRICIGQQFAYNEVSFMIIRLLQQFPSMSLDPKAQPEESKPPKEWAGMPGRQGVEQFKAQVHLTMYSAGGLWVKMKEAGSEA